MAKPKARATTPAGAPASTSSPRSSGPRRVGGLAAAGLHVTAPWFIGDVARIAPLRCAPQLAGHVLLLSGLLDVRAPAAQTRHFAEVLGPRAMLVERELGHTGWLCAGAGGPLRGDLEGWLSSVVSPR